MHWRRARGRHTQSARVAATGAIELAAAKFAAAVVNNGRIGLVRAAWRREARDFEAINVLARALLLQAVVAVALKVKVEKIEQRLTLLLVVDAVWRNLIEQQVVQIQRRSHQRRLLLLRGAHRRCRRGGGLCERVACPAAALTARLLERLLLLRARLAQTKARCLADFARAAPAAALALLNLTSTLTITRR